MDDKLINDGYRLYHGKHIDIYFSAQKCQHAGKCVRGSSALFNLQRKPWIMPDNADVNTAMTIIDTCPSGALQYRIK